MGKIFISIKNFILDFLFPRFCINCGREGNYLCDDCMTLLEITDKRYCLCKRPKVIDAKNLKCKKCQEKELDGLYFAIFYQQKILKKLISQFKYKPFIKELAKPLSLLILTHLQLLENRPDFADYILIPIPLNKKRLKWRGFNQAEEIAKELSKSLRILLISDVLIKIKKTLPQIELSKKQREENIKNAFFIKNREKIKDKKILLVDDVYTSGSTMEECAKVLKKDQAKEVLGIAIAREFID